MNPWHGIFGAFYLYQVRPDLPAKFMRKAGDIGLYVRRRYMIDEIVDVLVLKPSVKLAHFLKWIDEKIVDGTVLCVGKVNKVFGFVSAWIDRTFIDGAVNAVALVSQSFGSALRLFQTGRIQQYAAFAVGGGLLTAAWLILS